jgi:hypothetical protein
MCIVSGAGYCACRRLVCATPGRSVRAGDPSLAGALTNTTLITSKAQSDTCFQQTRCTTSDSFLLSFAFFCFALFCRCGAAYMFVEGAL